MFTDVKVLVRVLNPIRTFWEKITILHSVASGSKLRDRSSRHYYDIYMMVKNNLDEEALKASYLLEKIVKNNEIFFTDKKLNYQTAKLGSLNLVPNIDILDGLEKDYILMQEMFIGKPPEFSEIIKTISSLQIKLNDFVD